MSSKSSIRSALAWAGPSMAVLAIGALILVFLRQDRRPDMVQSAIVGDYRTRAERLDSVSSAISNRIEVPAEGSPHEAVMSIPEGDQGGLVKSMLNVHGYVLEEPTGRPVSNVRIGFAPHDTSGQTESPAFVEAQVGIDGRFEFELDPEVFRLTDFHRCRLVDMVDRLIFHQPIALQESMILTLPAPLRLVGTVTTDPPLDLSTIEVRATSLPSAASGSWTCGTARVDSAGMFEIVCKPQAKLQSFRLQFWNPSGALGVADLRAEDLYRSEGAKIHLRLGRIAIRVIGTDQRPIPGATLHVGLESGSMSSLVVSKVLNEQGSLALTVTGGWLEICAAKSGYYSEQMRVLNEPGRDQGEVDLVLRPLVPDARLVGRAVDPEGQPVAGAWVSVYSPGVSRDVAVASLLQTETDQFGRFDLPRDPLKAVAITATHKRLGRSPEATLPPSARQITIEFPAVRRLAVHFRTSASAGISACGPIQLYLVHRTQEFVVSEWSTSAPLAIEGLIEGEYNIFSYLPNGDYYGQSSVSIGASDQSVAEVWLSPAIWFEGRVVDATGRARSSLRVEAINAGWGPEVTRNWSCAGTAEDGRFRILGGEEHRVEIRVYDGSEELTRVPAVSGTPVLVTLPEKGMS